MQVGIETARDLVAAGNRLLVTGDMGIANTTASAALVAAFTGALRRARSPGAAPASTTPPTPARPPSSPRPWPSTARTPPTRSACSPRSAAWSTRGSPASCWARRRCARPWSSTAWCPARRRWSRPRWPRLRHTPGSRGTARSNRPIPWRSTHLGLAPALDLGLRVGEGTGALLAVPVVTAAARALADVATFDAAGVTEKSTTTRRRAP